MPIHLDHTIVPALDKIASATFFAEEEPGPGHHYVFHVSDAELDGIWARVKARGIPYGSGPGHRTDGRLYTHPGGRGFYFEDPYGHLLEVMTVPETGS